MATSNTIICNAALGRIGAQRINNFEDASDSKPEAIQCRTHFEMTRDSLIRSHYWRFASARATLSQDTDVPAFEWDIQFILPEDFLRFKSFYDDVPGQKTRHSFAIEGLRLLTNDNTCQIRYIRKITDPSKFDPLFVEVFVLLLADKLIGPLAGGDKDIQTKIDRAIAKLMPSVRALDRQETNTTGRADSETWNDVRATRGGRINSKLGSN